MDNLKIVHKTEIAEILAKQEESNEVSSKRYEK